MGRPFLAALLRQTGGKAKGTGQSLPTLRQQVAAHMGQNHLGCFDENRVFELVEDDKL
jgi:hypothetical protein